MNLNAGADDRFSQFIDAHVFTSAFSASPRFNHLFLAQVTPQRVKPLPNQISNFPSKSTTPTNRGRSASTLNVVALNRLSMMTRNESVRQSSRRATIE